MQYEVLYSYDIVTLNQKVINKMEQGWRPQGGVCVIPAPEVYKPNLLLFYQAMKRA